jgi:hypothetical protein
MKKSFRSSIAPLQTNLIRRPLTRAGKLFLTHINDDIFYRLSFLALEFQYRHRHPAPSLGRCMWTQETETTVRIHQLAAFTLQVARSFESRLFFLFFYYVLLISDGSTTGIPDSRKPPPPIAPSKSDYCFFSFIDWWTLLNF